MPVREYGMHYPNVSMSFLSQETDEPAEVDVSAPHF